MNEEILDILFNEVSLNLIGKLVYDGDLIKWEFDSLGYFITDDQLYEIYEDDLEMIQSSVDNSDIHCTEPHIEDYYISYYIEI